MIKYGKQRRVAKVKFNSSIKTWVILWRRWERLYLAYVPSSRPALCSFSNMHDTKLVWPGVLLISWNHNNGISDNANNLVFNVYFLDSHRPSKTKQESSPTCVVAGKKKCLNFQGKQWITQGNFHPINLSLPILLCAGNFHSWKMQKKTSVLFSVDLFRICNWCHQPTKKGIKLVFGSKMVYDVFNLLGNPVVPCWGRGGLPGSPSLCWPGHNSVHHYCNSEGFKSFWCDWMAWYRFLTVHVWWKNNNWLWVISLGFFPVEQFRLLLPRSHLWTPQK